MRRLLFFPLLRPDGWRAPQTAGTSSNPASPSRTIRLSSRSPRAVSPTLMTSALVIVATAALASMLSAQTPDPKKTPPTPKLVSDLYDWEKMVVTPTPKGARRAVFDGPTATVDKMHVHITT